MPTAEEVESARTPRAGWTRSQLAEWRVPWPPPTGWKEALLAASAGAEDAGPDEVER